MTFLVTALVGVPVLLAQIFLLPRLTPEKAIRVSDLPALFINPQSRVGLIAVLLIGLAHFAAYTYVAPSSSTVPVSTGRPLAHCCCSMVLLG